MSDREALAIYPPTAIKRLTSSNSSTASSTLPPHAKDARLVEQLIDRDAVAWRNFVDRYGRLIRSRVADVARSFSRGGDDAAIDDAAAEVFATLVTSECAALRAFQGRSSLSTYIAVIATRSATRSFARCRNHSVPVHQEAVEATPDHSSTFDLAGQMVANESRERLRDVVERLPKKQRDVVRLYHFEGRSYAEISSTLGMPIGSIGVTLRRAEQKLKEHLDPD